jgi:hypothetical protein
MQSWNNAFLPFLVILLLGVAAASGILPSLESAIGADSEEHLLGVVSKWLKALNTYDADGIAEVLSDDVVIPRLEVGRDLIWILTMVGRSINLNYGLDDCHVNANVVTCFAVEQSDMLTAAELPQGARGELSFTIENSEIRLLQESPSLRGGWEHALGSFKDWTEINYHNHFDRIWDDRGLLKTGVVETLAFLSLANHWIRCELELQFKGCPE